VPPAHLERDHHPVGRLHRVQDVHAELIEGLLQRPGPGNERIQAHLGAVDQDRIRVHLAERDLGIAPPVDGLGPQRQQTLQQSDHGLKSL